MLAEMGSKMATLGAFPFPNWSHTKKIIWSQRQKKSKKTQFDKKKPTKHQQLDPTTLLKKQNNQTNKFFQLG